MSNIIEKKKSKPMNNIISDKNRYNEEKIKQGNDCYNSSLPVVLPAHHIELSGNSAVMCYIDLSLHIFPDPFPTW